MIITFALFDAVGAPLTGATPTFAQYLSAITGVDLSGSAPAITEIGGGIYGFDAVLSGEGIAYYINGGTSAAPQYFGGGQGDNGVVVLPFFANDGSPAGVCIASIDTYEDGDGNPVTPPALNSLNNTGLFSFLPSGADIAARLSFMVSSNKNPTQYFGQLESAGAPIIIPPADTTAPTVVMTRPANDSRLLDVIFDEQVVDAEALTPSNYSIDHGLVVTKVEKISGIQYRLTTSRQTPGVVYTVSVTGIHDMSGNLI